MLVPAGNLSAFTAALASLVQDHDRRLAFARAAVAVAETRFSLDAWVRGAETVYEAVCASTRAADETSAWNRHAGRRCSAAPLRPWPLASIFWVVEPSTFVSTANAGQFGTGDDSGPCGLNPTWDVGGELAALLPSSPTARCSAISSRSHSDIPRRSARRFCEGRRLGSTIAASIRCRRAPASPDRPAPPSMFSIAHSIFAVAAAAW